MRFEWPFVLFLLALPAGWLAREFARRVRVTSRDLPHILRAEAGPRSLRLAGSAGSETGPSWRSGPRVWLAAGLALGIVALARPQWGALDQPVFEQAREIVIALDLSKSMLTPDVKPTRLERAKLMIRSLLDRLQGERVGLLDFSGTAFLQSPLSADYEILREFLPDLNPGYMPIGGTNYGAMIDTAADAFSTGGSADRYLIVLSDGGATDEDWRSHIAKLKEKGIRVIALGVGTEKGALMPDGADGYIKDERGAVVVSKLDNANLKELAQATGGVYKDASNWVDLAAVLKATVEAGKKGRFMEKNSVLLAERFQWALAPALLCLLISFWREFPVRPKPRDVRLAGAGGGKSEAGSRSRELAGVAAVLLAAAVLGAPRARAQDASSQTASSGALLGKIVGRLSAQDSQSALDWSELARQTLSWGHDLQSANSPVPPGPVRDGLAAVDRGSALDAKAANWDELRSQLQELLTDEQKKPPPQKQNQQQQQQQQQQQNQKSQQQSGGSQQQQGRQQQQNGQQSQSAFGQMPPPSQQPRQQSGTQEIGGQQQQDKNDPASADPELAPLVGKMDDLKNQDSPAQLFRMIENKEPKPEDTSKGKDW